MCRPGPEPPSRRRRAKRANQPSRSARAPVSIAGLSARLTIMQMPDETENSKKPDQAQPNPDVKTWTFSRTFTIGKPPVDDPNVTIIEGPTQTIEWKWGGLGQGEGQAQAQT